MRFPTSTERQFPTSEEKRRASDIRTSAQSGLRLDLDMGIQKRGFRQGRQPFLSEGGGRLGTLNNQGGG
jgi:hypothetical protein